MGGHEHGHHESFTIPDYRIYKVSDVPKLAEVEKALAEKGLKDPWLRNEVWRYNVKEFGTEASRIKATFGTGFKLGFAAFVITIVGTKLYDKMYPSEHGHGSDHH